MREGWEQYRFDEVFNLQMGKTPDRKTPQYFGGDNVWVSIRDLVKKEIFDSNEHITDEAILASNIRQVKKGTVIMSFKLTVGKCAIAGKDLYTNEAIIAFNLKEGYEIIPNFLYYYLQGYKWEGANKAVMGLTLNKATISKHKIAFPPLSTQQSIVSELDKINELISLKKSQLEDLDSLAQSIFYDMFGDPVENEKGWEVKKLGEICDVRDGTHDSPSYYEKGYPLITSKNVIDGIISFENVNYINKEDFDKISRRSKVDNGDIIMPMIGTIGRPIIVKKNREFAIKNVALIKFLHESKVLNTYIQAVMSSSSFDFHMKRKNKGGTQKFIALGEIRKLKIPLPPLSLQQTFAKRIEVIEQQKQQINKTIKDLETLLASRMQYWFD